MPVLDFHIMSLCGAVCLLSMLLLCYSICLREEYGIDALMTRLILKCDMTTKWKEKLQGICESKE